MIAFVNEMLIQNNVWLSILQGLSVTLEITGASLVLGTLLAVPVCMVRTSPRPFMAWTGKTYIAFIRGTPVLMLLMLFYYVVFQSSRMDAVYIAMIAFSLNVSGVVAEIMRSALLAVPKTQMDAARAMGMGRFATFFYVILPQAVSVALPVYKSAAVNLLQWTCVVGYISITDLTRAINYVSTRTMEPLLMLFIGIAIYLGLSYLLSGVFSWIGRYRFGMSHRYYRRKHK